MILRILAFLAFGSLSFGQFALPGTIVHFSPKGGCEAEVVKRIKAAKTKIRVQCYSFTSHPVIDALVAATVRKVDVAVTLDKTWNLQTTAGLQALIDAKIPVKLDGKHPIDHSKFVVVDDIIIVTGSFNYTAQAENSNNENLLTLFSTRLAKQYGDNWQLHWGHCEDPPIPLPASSAGRRIVPLRTFHTGTK